MLDSREQEALVCGQHNNPFAVLGLHHTPDGRVVYMYGTARMEAALLGARGGPPEAPGVPGGGVA